MNEIIPNQAPEIHDWSGKSKEEIVTALESILESRVSHSPDAPSDRVEELRAAIHNLPTVLDNALFAASKSLADANVKSYTILIMGGFAREISAGKIDEHTSVDTSVRKDTDIDVSVTCASRDGTRIAVNSFPSPLSSVLHEWRQGELGRIVELAFNDVKKPSKTHAAKPRIVLWSREVPDL